MRDQSRFLGVSNKRILTIVLICFVVIMLLVLRVGYVQLIEGAKYSRLSTKNSVQIKFVAPSRGKILDENGEVLAENKIIQNAVIRLKPHENVSLAIETVNNILPLQEEDVLRVLKLYKRYGVGVPLVIRQNLTWDEILIIERYQDKVPFLHVEEAESRHYPLGSMSIHPLGYTGFISSKEREDLKVFNQLPDLKIGKSGLERELNKYLIGLPGVKEYEVNARGQKVRRISKQLSKTGGATKTTINKELQNYMYSLVSQYKAGTAIVMDVNTGAIKGMVSHPGFDPELFSKPLSPEHWNELLYRVDTPFLNKAIAGLYPPGSLLKPFVLLSALENKVVNLGTKVECDGAYKLKKLKAHCWKKFGHGQVDAGRSLRESCDIYYYNIGAKIGVDPLTTTLKKFGFGQSTGVELVGEQKGLLPSSEWKRRVKKESWYLADTIFLAIGQGYISATPLQMLVAFSIIANGGFKVKPQFFKQENIGELRERVAVSKSQLKKVQKMLSDVVNHPRGTARRIVEFCDEKVAGKTGTSQVRRITEKERKSGKYKAEDYDWFERDHAIFAGYGPVEKPKYAVIVVLEHEGFGSRTAAPLGGKILQKVFDLDKECAQKELERSTKVRD